MTVGEARPSWRYIWGDYVALSYTWGEPSWTTQILVNGHRVVVQSNLEASLRQFARKAVMQTRLWIWIDAICINQADLAERQREVPRMRSIYKTAREIVVWLGEEADKSDLAIRLIRKMAESCQKDTIMLLGQDLRAHPDLFGAGCWLGLALLMSRPYWRRVWIMQEIAMGNAATTFLCGREVATWSDFYDAIYTFTNSHLDMVSRYVEKGYRDAGASGIQGLNRNRITQLTSEQKIQATDPEHIHPSLMPLLDIARSSMATDPRDRVYGILGLMPGAFREVIKVDYTLPVTEVYTCFARSMITESKSPSKDALMA
ncbi:hypothetical protein VMCG_08499 [Cytospora schulzeri]|uniref:Heterokaryon incompatibility domain-containing protein n=1 Tax=Cytospora schulzeri TaxID=448051 RepID=A0A423VWH1_9PEZI|nr:hypothetical protein VMCG_08499 [Valsa malicola]